MLEQLLQTAVQYIDTAMVGSLGTQATAAVGSTTTVGWVIQFTVSALGVGFLALISQRRGAGDFEGAREVAAQAVLAVLAVGSIFTAAPLLLHKQIPVWMQVDESIRELAGQYFFILYLPMLLRTASLIFGTVLRAAGDTKTPMKVGLTVNIVNVVLNFLLIYPTRRVTLFGLSIVLPGADLGVLGAAGASAAAFALGGVYTTVKLLRHRDISPLGHSLRPNKKILLPCIKIALPNMLQKFGTSMGYATFSSMINALGEAATAAHTIANTVESAFYIPGYGMQTAAATLAGNAIGARDKAALKKLARVFIPIEVGLMAISGLILFVSAPALVGLFSTSATVIALGSTVLRIVAVSEPFYGFSIIIDGMMHGGGLTTKPFIYNICGMWGIRIVGTFICTAVLNFGFVSCWVCMVANNMAIFALYLCDYIRGKWYPKSLDTQ
jgi:putative MATE family efflux protein